LGAQIVDLLLQRRCVRQMGLVAQQKLLCQVDELGVEVFAGGLQQGVDGLGRGAYQVLRHGFFGHPVHALQAIAIFSA
jgi:hypothetical protein